MTDPATGAARTTRYLVDDQNPTGLPQVVEELDGAGRVTQVHVWGEELLSVRRAPEPPAQAPEVVAPAAQWPVRYYGYDGMGNVRFLTDGAGQVTDTYDYDTFGNLVARTGSTPNDYLFQGQQFDRDLGLYHMRARYYNPATGRFWSADPIIGSVFSPEGLNRYCYGNANPVAYTDPEGTWGTSLFQVTQDAWLWFESRRRVDDGFSALPAGVVDFYAPGSGVFATALERRAPYRTQQAWLAGGGDGLTVGSLLGEANQGNFIRATDMADDRIRVPDQNYFSLAAVGIASKLERDVETAQGLINNLSGMLRTNGLQDQSFPNPKYDWLNYWLESAYHEGFFKALQVGGDPLEETIRRYEGGGTAGPGGLSAVGISVYPAHAGQLSGVRLTAAPTAQAMRFLRPKMGAEPGNAFHSAVNRYRYTAAQGLGQWSMTGLDPTGNIRGSAAFMGSVAYSSASFIPFFGRALDAVETGYAINNALADGDYGRAAGEGALAILPAFLRKAMKGMGALRGRAAGEGGAAAAHMPASGAVASLARAGENAAQVTVGRFTHGELRDKIREAMAQGYTKAESIRMIREGKLCFVAGTKVLTDRGLKNIEEIRPGDRVLSKSDRTGEQGWRKVKQTFVSQPDKLVHLRYKRREARNRTAAGQTRSVSSCRADAPARATGGAEGAGCSSEGEDGDSDGDSDESNPGDEDGSAGELTGTPGHPFWSLDRGGWVEMAELRPGEGLLLSDGAEGEVVSSWFEQASAGTTFTTYNFEVEEWHSYFVAGEAAGSGEVWVHNSCSDDAAFKGPKRPRSPLGADVSYRDPHPVQYKGGKITPDTPVIDHKRARALGGHPTDPANLSIRAWVENSRKGWHEGNYLRERRKLMRGGLTREQSEWVLEDYLRWIENDIHATPVPIEKLDELLSP